MGTRIVCHIDLDAFFAGVEEKLDPSLKGKPVLVAAGPIGRGAVACPSYPARKLGVKTGMSVREALAIIPSAIVISANYEEYQKASEKILSILYRFTPDIEPISLDESFFELTHIQNRWASPYDAVKEIQDAIWDEVGLSASFGVSSGKALAKIASDFQKPRGITVVPFGEEAEWIASIPVKNVPGVGYATQKKLLDKDVHVCVDLLKLNPSVLHTMLGQVHGTYLWELAHGKDERRLQQRSDAKSISHQSTLQKSTRDFDYVESLFLYIAERCIWRMRTAQLATREISIFLRYSDQTHESLIRRLVQRTQTDSALLDLVLEMTHEIRRKNKRVPVSFVGLRIADLVRVQPQMDLFAAENSRKEQLADTLQHIRERFGNKVIATARTYNLHREYRLAQAGISFSVARIDKESLNVPKNDEKPGTP